MSHVTSAIMLLALALPSIALAEWYAIQGKPTTTIRLQEHGKSIEVAVRKIDLQVTALILRHDTDDAKRYWVEATLTKLLDSGDGYLLAFDDVVLGKIRTRGDKWAIGFDSLDLARRCFQHLLRLHKLDQEHACDATKAQQIDADERAPLSRLLLRFAPAGAAPAPRVADLFALGLIADAQFE